MTTAAGTDQNPEAGYALTYPPDGTAFTVRENLVDILERELLGPINGPDELLPFSPRSQYLIGQIAPVRLTGAAAGTDTGEDRERGELMEPRTDDAAMTEVRGVPANAADEHEAEDRKSVV